MCIHIKSDLRIKISVCMNREARFTRQLHPVAILHVAGVCGPTINPYAQGYCYCFSCSFEAYMSVLLTCYNCIIILEILMQYMHMYFGLI